MTASLDPPRSSVAIWSPLLIHMQSLHSSLPSILVHRIISRLLPQPQTPEEAQEEDTLLLTEDAQKTDSSYSFCLASWAKYLIDSWGVEEYNERNETDLNRTEVVTAIISGLGPHKEHPSDEEK